jgi:hypothetical protein
MRKPYWYGGYFTGAGDGQGDSNADACNVLGSPALDLSAGGGWKTCRSGELGFAFQCPAVYDELDCGRILLFE